MTNYKILVISHYKKVWLFEKKGVSLHPQIKVCSGCSAVGSVHVWGA